MIIDCDVAGVSAIKVGSMASTTSRNFSHENNNIINEMMSYTINLGINKEGVSLKLDVTSSALSSAI